MSFRKHIDLILLPFCHSFTVLDRRNRLVMDNRAVAFLARMDHTLLHLGQHQNVRYDTVVTNIGGGYHQSHGVFIAPVAGIYIFSTTVLSLNKPHGWVELEIEKNGGLLATAYAYGDADRDQGSVTVVTQVAVSDEVWVRVRFPTTEAQIFGSGLSSFMGCLIMPTET